jgi:hypothetical protein
MSAKYLARTTRVSIMPEGEPLFSEKCTHVEIQDEAGGEYVVIRQNLGGDNESVSIDPEEWPLIKRSVDEMVANLKQYE